MQNFHKVSFFSSYTRVFLIFFSIFKIKIKMQALTDDLRNALVRQAHVEYQSSLLYLNFAYWFDNHDFEGIGTFFKKESEEERNHAIQILDFLNVRGFDVAINPAELAFGQNETLKFNKPFDLFTVYKKREEGNYVTLNEIAKQAQKVDGLEPLTLHFINSMLEDQAASCDEVQKLYAKATAYNALPGLFYHLDKELRTSSHNFDTWKQK